MKAKEQDLTALVGSRICHDLISPLGAIGNGVELLTMSGAMAGPEMALISESIDNANARIKFFRIAFGAASAGQTVGRTEILSILDDMTRGNRLKIEWTPSGDQERGEVRLAFLLLQCFESAMPYGGTVRIAAENGHWQMVGSATKTKIDPGIWARAGDPAAPAELTPAQVHFALVPDALRAFDRRLYTELTETQITVRF